MGPSWYPKDPSYGFRDTSIRLFLDNGGEIRLDDWERVVHAGMVAVVEYTPAARGRQQCMGVSQV